jgi:hypothetical protein
MSQNRETGEQNEGLTLSFQRAGTPLDEEPKVPYAQRVYIDDEEFDVLKKMAEEGYVIQQQPEHLAHDLLLSPQCGDSSVIRPVTTQLLYVGGCLTLRNDRQTYEINGTGQAVYQYQRARRDGDRSSEQPS